VGLRRDRRSLVLNPDGSVLTAREPHEQLAITGTPTGQDEIALRDSTAPLARRLLQRLAKQAEKTKTPGLARVSEVGRYWARTSDPKLC
jgi:hypothetical protein